MSIPFVFIGSFIYMLQVAFAVLSRKTVAWPNLNLISIAYRGLLLGVFFVSAHCAFLYAKLAELPAGAPLATEYGRLVAASVLVIAGYEMTKAVACWTGAAKSFMKFFINLATGIAAVIASGVLLYYTIKMI
ncbi:hypothetical protein [Desulfotruncus alcoholivorax]|uniref:hypothetical protein n=1 Tax=Desulfotruncus alcoholivorax TaxID=265477 RepID=UPI0004111FD4|nr:hypothetical protein [Desulfotruncus alcoholivorax]